MEYRDKERFINREILNAQEAPKEMLNILSHQVNANHNDRDSTLNQSEQLR